MGGNMMKKSFVILAVMLVINQNVFSQDADKNTERKFTIQSSPLLWFIDVFTDDNSDDILFAMDLESQFKITNSANVSLTFSFLINNHTVGYDYADDDRNPYKENVYQLNFKPMFVYRPFETGIQGFYLGFFPKAGLLHVENNDKNQFFTEIGFGINLGYKWVFRSGFTMQLGGGMSKTFSIPKGSKHYIPVNSDGSIPLTYTDIHLLDFKLGYSF
jgi:hypothetical protein